LPENGVDSDVGNGRSEMREGEKCIWRRDGAREVVSFPERCCDFRRGKRKEEGFTDLEDPTRACEKSTLVAGVLGPTRRACRDYNDLYRRFVLDRSVPRWSKPKEANDVSDRYFKATG
jgi:hypothetical protein